MTPRSLLAPARLAGQPVLRTQSDERLVDLARAGSEPAFEAIVARYRRALLRYCSRILPEERAEDAVQQTFVRAYDSMLGSTRELALRPWLYRIAHNTALNALRDRGLRHEALDEEIDGVEQPHQALERAQGLRAVLGAVQDLPERQRDAMVLREIEGRTYEEIAAELGVTGGAVRQLLNRARHSVRAAATAITPFGFVERLPELGTAGGAAGGGALVAKAAATVLVTGAVVGGVAVAPKHDEQAAEAAPTHSAPAPKHAANAPAVASLAARSRGPGSGSGHSGSSDGAQGRDDGGHGRGRGGPGSGRRRSGRDGDDGGHHSGSGGGERRDASDGDDRSGGSGMGGSGSGSGSGDGGSGGSGSGSGSGDGGGSGENLSDKGGSGGGGSDDIAETQPPATTTAPSGSDDSVSGDSGNGGSGGGGGSDDSH